MSQSSSDSASVVSSATGAFRLGGHHCLLIKSTATSKISKAPKTTRNKAKSKNGVMAC
jgi:hypothetical protein